MLRTSLRLLVALGLWLGATSLVQAQVPNWPQTLPANTVVGRLNIGPGPAQAVPISALTGTLFSSMSGDCTMTVGGVITCTETNGVAFGNLATQGTISSSYVIGNFTGSAANATAQQVPSCASDGVHALTNPSSGGFGCQSLGLGTFSPGFTTLSYNGSAWVCYGPTGTAISTSGTTTSGMQECWNSAKTNHTNFRANCLNFDASTPISASTTVTLGPADGTLIDLRGCYFTSSATTALVVDSLEFSSVLDWSAGYISCTGATTACVELNPTHATGAGVYGIGWSTLKFPSIVMSCASTGGDDYAFYVIPGNGPGSSINAAVYGNFISIAAIDGYDGSHYCPVDGVYVVNPTNAYAAFGQNEIHIGYIQGVDANYLENGSGPITQATQALATNKWFVGSIGTNGSASYGILDYGFDDEWHVDVSVNGGTLTDGMSFAAATANGNWLVAPQLAGSTPLSDSGTSVKNYGFVNGTGYKTGGTF